MNLDVATKLVQEDEGNAATLVNDLCEDAQLEQLKKGQDVMVMHGILAGSRAKFEGVANNGYVSVRTENGGVTQVPHGFVRAAEPLK